MILIDSSVWIGFFNGRSTPAVEELARLLDEGAAPLAIADLVFFEVLRGFRLDAHLRAAERALAAIDVVSVGGPEIARLAAREWRALRAAGITIESPVDALQATWCIEHGHALLFDDRDYLAYVSRGLRPWVGSVSQ